MFKNFKKLFNAKLLLAPFVLFVGVFYSIDILNHIKFFHSHSLYFDFLLTCIFSIIVLLLLTAAKINNEKHIQLKSVQIFDLLEEETSMVNPKTLTFTYLNKSFLDNTQYESNELLGQCIDKTNPDCEPKDMQKFIRSLIMGEIDELKYTTLRARKDGSKYPIKTILKYFRGINSLVAFSNDITSENKIENIKYQFISSLNHELRTPLSAISGALSIISNKLVGEAPASMKEMLNIINNNTIRLLELVGDLVNVEKLEAKYDFDFSTKPFKNE